MRITVLSLAAVLLTTHVFAQSAGKTSKFGFGFSIGLNYSMPRLQGIAPVVIKSAKAEGRMGFELGLLASYTFSDYFSARIRPAVTFDDAAVLVTRVNNSTERYEVPPYIDIPLHAIYSIKGAALKPYVIIGPRFRLPAILDGPMQLTRSTLSIDIGIGFEKALSHFRFAPELNYSFGVSNLSNINGVNYMKLHALSLVFNFRR